MIIYLCFGGGFFVNNYFLHNLKREINLRHMYNFSVFKPTQKNICHGIACFGLFFKKVIQTGVSWATVKDLISY